MQMHYTLTAGINIILNVPFVMTFLPLLKTWRNTSGKNMVDSSPVSRSYRPRDTGKRGWSKVSEERRRPKQRRGEPSTSHARMCVEGFDTKRELDKHMTDKHIFICGECLKTFKTKEERDTHMKTDHKDVSTEMTKQEKLLAEEYHKRGVQRRKGQMSHRNLEEGVDTVHSQEGMVGG